MSATLHDGSTDMMAEDPLEQDWHDRYNVELNKYEDRCRAAGLLTGDAQQLASAQALAEWQSFLGTKPGRRPATAVTARAVDDPTDPGTPQPPPEPQVQPTATPAPDLSSSLGHSQC